jgi:hypothetical protein
MTQTRNKLYSLLIIACIAGYIWLFIGLVQENSTSKPVEVCLIKHVTNIPCPSCGSTRSILSLIKGNLIQAFSINPIGILIALILILTPLWIIADVKAKRNTLFVFYQKTETYLKRPKLAIPLVLIVILNWIWNITKGL